MKHVLKILLWLCPLPFACLQAQGPSPSVAPTPQGFTLNSGDLSSLSDAVNLFTGEVTFPLQLIDLPGKGGTNINVSLNYNSNTDDKVDVKAGEAPTSTVGLGWELVIPKIVVNHQGTGAVDDDVFYLLSGNSPIRLIFLGLDNGIKRYRTSSQGDRTTITYDGKKEKWTIRNTDGSTLVYGDTVSGRNTVQWSVFWGNWTGASAETESQVRRATTWNLSESRSTWGNSLLFNYEHTEERVGFADHPSPRKSYTKASYIKEIIQQDGGKVIFHYRKKLRHTTPTNDGRANGGPVTEYADPETRQNEPDAYQERYEDRYLDWIQVYAKNNVPIQSVHFNYSFLDPGRNVYAKRLLKSISKKNAEGIDLGEQRFNYLPSGPRKGAIAEVSNPMGGKVRFHYSSRGVRIGHSNRDRTIGPGVNGYAEPRTWIQENYTLATWRELNSNGTHDTGPKKVRLFAYRWEGEWKETHLDVITEVRLKDLTHGMGKDRKYYQDFQLVTSEEHFALLRRIEGTNIYTVYLYRQSPLYPSGWVKTSRNVDLGGHNPDFVKLIAGQGFIAVTSNNHRIFTFRLTGEGWDDKLIAQTGGTYNTTGMGNYLIRQRIDTSPDKLTFYYLNEGKEWKEKNIPSEINTSKAESSVWRAHGTHALVKIGDRSGRVISWNSGYTEFSEKISELYVPSTRKIFSIGHDQLSTYGPGRIYTGRYTGSSWQYQEFESKYGVHAASAFGDDLISLQTEQNIIKLKAYDHRRRVWEDLRIYNGKNHGNLVKIGHKNFILNGKVYFMKSDRGISEGYDLPLRSGTISTNSAEVHNGGNFAVYENDGYDHQGVHIAIFKDGQLLPKSEFFPKRTISRIFSKAKLTVLDELQCVGPKTVITVSRHLKWDMEEATDLRLHRISHERALGKRKFYPVIRLETENENATNASTFVYHGETATVDASGTTALFNKVIVVHGSNTTLNTPYGSSENYFYNGLANDEVGNTFPKSADAGQWHRAFIGRNYRSIAKDFQGKEVSETETLFAVHRERVFHGQGHQIALITTARTSQITSVKDGVSNRTEYFYKKTGQIARKLIRGSKTPTGTTGDIEERSTYLWEIDDAVQKAGVYNLPAMIVTLFNGKPITASKFTYKNHSLGPDPIYGLHCNWVWKGKGTVTYNDFDTERWQRDTEVLQVDHASGATLLQKDRADNYTYRSFGPSNDMLEVELKVAERNNFTKDDFAYTGFEHGTESFAYWSVSPAVHIEYLSEDALMGRFSFEGANTQLSAEVGHGTYTLSYFLKQGANVTPKVKTTRGAVLDSKEGELLSGWRYHEHTIELREKATILLTLNGKIDELRLIPYGASISTYAYNRYGQRMAVNNTHNRPIFFEYDDRQRPSIVRDAHGQIRDHTEYFFRHENSNGDLEPGASDYSRDAIIHTKVKKGGVHTLNQLHSLTIGEKQQIVSYLDAFGRTVQTVDIQASPAKKDMVEFTKYDALGRESKSFLPYARSSGRGGFVENPIEEQRAFYRQSPAVAESPFPMGTLKYEKSPLGRTREQGGAGADWQVGKIGAVKYSYAHNTDKDTILYWQVKPSNGRPFIDRHYSSKELFKITKVGPEGSTISYVDKHGRTVLEKMSLSDGKWSETAYIYDGKGRMLFRLSPELMERARRSNRIKERWRPSVEELGRYAFVNTYDAKGRLVQESSPGRAPIFHIYDPLDREIMSQDGNQRTSDQWSFVKYDAKGRVALTGIYQNSTYKGLEIMQAFADGFYERNPPNKWYETKGNQVLRYTNRAFPLIVHEKAYLTVNYYDNYDFPISSQQFFVSEMGHEEYFHRVDGLETSNRVRILGSNQWLTTVTYYDEFHRTIQVHTSNITGGVDRISIRYDHEGLAIANKVSHRRKGQREYNVTSTYEMDHAGRELRHWHQIDNGPNVLISEKKYNELGQLIEKNLHSRDNGLSFVQSIDFRYNIKGWLTNINTPSLNNNAENPDSGMPKDLFGMRYLYETKDNKIGNKKRYDGAASAMVWSQWDSGHERERMAYRFEYTANAWLSSADLLQETKDWTNTEGHFGVKSISYDRNGNITGLKRSGADGQCVDDLLFRYQGNQLMSVEDMANGLLGFIDGHPKGEDYRYDTNGNLSHDLNKGIRRITYNLLNMPETIQFQDGSRIVNTYDALGNKLMTRAFAGSQEVKISEYHGSFAYEQDKLKHIAHAEGRALPSGDSFDYHYDIYDLQGSPRITFSTERKSHQFQATFETEDEAVERHTFGKGYEKLKTVSAALFNHTKSPDAHRSLRLDASPNNSIGLAKSFRVYSGDRVTVEVFAKHTEAYNVQRHSNIGLHLGQAFVDAFAIPLSEGSAVFRDYFKELFSAGSLFAEKGNTDLPRAGINYLLFDKDFNLIDQGHSNVGPESLEKGKGAAHELLKLEINVKQGGYLYTYLSNESPQVRDVYFDDYKLTLSEGPIVQSQAYYPFGMPIPDVGFFREDIAVDYIALHRMIDSVEVNTYKSTFGEGKQNLLGPITLYDRRSRIESTGLIVHDHIPFPIDHSAADMALELETIPGRVYTLSMEVDLVESGQLLHNPVKVFYQQGDLPLGSIDEDGHHVFSFVAEDTVSTLSFDLPIPTNIPVDVQFEAFIIHDIKVSHSLPRLRTDLGYAPVPPSRHLYQNKDFQTVMALDWYDFHARQYDPTLGRFLSPDPKDQFYSPYLGMGNNPMMTVDPSGEIVWFVPAVIAISAVINVASNWDTISQSDGFWQGVGTAAKFAAVGGVQGGLSLLGPGGVALGGVIGGVGNAYLNGARGGNLVKAAVIGGATAYVGNIAGKAAGPLLDRATRQILNPMVSQAVGGMIGGAITGGILGGSLSAIEGNGFGNGFKSGFVFGGISGFVGGAVSGYGQARQLGFDPFTGKRIHPLIVPNALPTRATGPLVGPPPPPPNRILLPRPAVVPHSSELYKSYYLNNRGPIKIHLFDKRSFVKPAQHRSFKSYTAFKREFGSAGPGRAWHHIVEQNSANVAKFGHQRLHTTVNIVNVPHGKGSLHAKISGYYSSKQISITKSSELTIRQWLNTKSFEFQYEFGIQTLKNFGWTPE